MLCTDDGSRIRKRSRQTIIYQSGFYVALTGDIIIACFSCLLLDLSPPYHLPDFFFFLRRFLSGFSLSFCLGRFPLSIIKGFWETHGVDFHHLFS